MHEKVQRLARFRNAFDGAGDARLDDVHVRQVRVPPLDLLNEVPECLVDVRERHPHV